MRSIGLVTMGAHVSSLLACGQVLDAQIWQDALLVIVIGVWLVVLPVADFVLAWKLGWRPTTITAKGCAAFVVPFSPIVFVGLLVAYLLERASRHRNN